MSSIVTAVFKATIGLLVNKGRDKAAERLKDGDVTDLKFRGLIVHEIDDIKFKLDGLSRKDLLTSIDYFEEGIGFLYEVFDEAKFRGEYGAVTTQAARAEAFSLAERLRTLELTDLDKSATRALSNAKERFRDARREATRAFNNEVLETSDRILAMQLRVMATILETVDNPADAVVPCRLWMEELHCLPAVQNCFHVELTKGFRARFGKNERRGIIVAVCTTNRCVYDFLQTLGSKVQLPPISIGKEDVDPLSDERVLNVLSKFGIEFQAPQEILARGPLAVQAYQKSLSEGETRVMRVPIMLIGQGQSGKTSLKRSLKGERFDPEEKRTEMMEMDPSYCKVSTEVWKLGEKTQEANSDRMPISYEQRTAKYMLSNLKEGRKGRKEERKEPASSQVTYDKVIVHDVDAATVDYKESFSDIHDEPRDTPLTIPQVPNVPELPEVPEEIAGWIERLQQVVCNEGDEEEIYSVLWDFGGQSVYYTTHPLFLTPRAIYCLVHNLSRNPDEKVSPPRMHGFFEDVEDVFCKRSDMDYLDFWMSSVSSLVTQDEQPQETSASEILPERLPPVFLVCTHADKPYQNRHPEELAYKIFGSLQSKCYGEHLVDVFVVDNTKSGSGQECQGVTRLREKILNVAEELPQMKEVIPIKWLKYEKAFRALLEGGKKWISLVDAKKIALDVCGISSDEQFLALLNFLHDQRILIHFDDTPELNKMVILDPQWLVDVFKKIITITPYKTEERKFKEAWLRLEKTGILEEKLLQHAWGPLFDDRETCNSLIAMMEKFCLLCPWPSSSEGERPNNYLVPSMLKSPPEQDVTKLIASSGMPSLVVRFTSGHVPPGLFPRLVLMVFQWCIKEWVGKSLPTLHHNFARFYTHPAEGCSLILHCHPSFIEVVVHKNECTPEKSTIVQQGMNLSPERSYDPFQVAFAHTVCRQLGLILECMRKEFPWLKNMVYEMAVCCPVCCEQGSLNYLCPRHNVLGCKRDECLHFWSESQLRDCQGPIICTASAVAGDYRVPVKLFGHWFKFMDEQRAIDGRDGRALPCKEGYVEQALALPSGVLQALQLQTCSADDVVARLQEDLSLDQASLKQPDPETKRQIRCLCMKAKTANRLDVVRKLREIAPAGTTGPVLPEALDVKSIPLRQRQELTINLCGRDEWKLFAERLGLTPAEILYLDKRVLNPCDAALAHSRNQGFITSVGDVYDELVNCELPIIADLL